MLSASRDTPGVGALPPRDFLRQMPRLTPDLELEFQAEYYARILPTLRLISLLLAGLVSAQTLHLGAFDPYGLFQLFFWLCVFALTWIPRFGRVWQPALMLMGWITAALVFGSIAHPMVGGPNGVPGAGLPKPSVPQQEFFFMLQMTVLMVTLSTLRLNFRWTALLQMGVLLIGLWNVRTNLPPDAHPSKFIHFVLLPGIIVLLVLLLASFVQEWLARVAFWAGHLLAEERDVERRQREQTEGQLKILARAIGSIVHDLGNPMTVVQMGADMLAMQFESQDITAIQEAGQMLAALRLSLIEQTRVLEGKRIPVDLRAESLRPIIDAGARFQNRRMTFGRTVSLSGDDLEIYADRLKLTTVFMNLIGNSLKYSDGNVRIVWRIAGDVILAGVLDQGTAGKGISESQAQKLFVAFGRLEAHAQVEGTGLGLISARKIVEAHGGEAFIEGYRDGVAASPRFSTAERHYASLLESDFVTGFVMALPLHHTEETSPEHDTK